MSSDLITTAISRHGQWVLSVLLLLVFPAPLVAAPPITDVTFAPDGKSVVACSQAGVYVYRWPDLSRTEICESASANVNSVVFSPNGRQIAVGGGDPAEVGRLEIYDRAGGSQKHRLHSLISDEDSIPATAWVDDKTVVSASRDRSICVWKLDSEGRRLLTLNGHSRSVEALCMLRDGKTLVSAGVDQSLRVWDLAAGDLIRSLNQHTKRVNALSLRPATEGLPMVASAAEDRTIRLWQPTIGRMVRYVRLEVKPLDIVWLPDGKHIAAACVDGKVRIVDAEQVKVVQTLAALDGWAYTVAAHPSDGSIVVGGSRGKLRRLAVQVGRDSP